MFVSLNICKIVFICFIFNSRSFCQPSFGLHVGFPFLNFLILSLFSFLDPLFFTFSSLCFVALESVFFGESVFGILGLFGFLASFSFVSLIFFLFVVLRFFCWHSCFSWLFRPDLGFSLAQRRVSAK